MSQFYYNVKLGLKRTKVVVKTPIASMKFEVTRLVILVYLTNDSILVQLAVTEKVGSCPVLRP